MKQSGILGVIVAIVLLFNFNIVEVNADIFYKSGVEVDELEKKKQEITKVMSDKEEEIEDMMLELELLNDDKKDLEEEIKKNERRIKRARKQIKTTREEVNELKESIEKRRELVGNRLLSQQRQGDVKYLEVLFGSTSFVDFISRLSSMSKIYEADNEIISSFMNDKDELERKLSRVERLRENLRKILDENKKDKIDLEEHIKAISDKKSKLDKELELLNVDTRAIEEKQNQLIERVNREFGVNVGFGKGELMWPTEGGYVSSGIGPRFHPIKKEDRLHKGIDIARTDKSVSPPIYAADDGVVMFAGSAGGFGNMVKIKHDGELITLYGHLATLSVKTGETVNRGQKIGIMGATGDSTGIHLHFEVHLDNKLQNPLRYIDIE